MTRRRDGDGDDNDDDDDDNDDDDDVDSVDSVDSDHRPAMIIAIERAVPGSAKRRPAHDSSGHDNASALATSSICSAVVVDTVRGEAAEPGDTGRPVVEGAGHNGSAS